MSDLLEEIFSRAAAFETGGRHIDYIKLDMNTRQVEVRLTAVPGGEYYDTILAQQQDTIQQARQNHYVWTKRHGGGVTEEDLTERVGLILKSLLDSKFLRDDYYEIPKSKRTNAGLGRTLGNFPIKRIQRRWTTRPAFCTTKQSVKNRWILP